jgi:hypothetical protein
VIVNRDRKSSLSEVLANNVLVKKGLNVFRLRNLRLSGKNGLRLYLFSDDIVAEVDTLVADIH